MTVRDIILTQGAAWPELLEPSDCPRDERHPPVLDRQAIIIIAASVLLFLTISIATVLLFLIINMATIMIALRGVDGFRMDAVPFLFEDRQFRDEPVSGKTDVKQLM